MSRIIPILIVLSLGYALLGGCDDKAAPSRSSYTQGRQLAAENQELRQQNADLANLQAQTLSELQKTRRSADRADVALRTSYLGYAPLGVVLVLLGGGLATTCFLVIRRRRR